VDDWQGLLVKVKETGQDRLAPTFDHAQLRDLVFLDVTSKGATGDFRDKHDFIFVLVLPPGDEMNNVWVLETLNQFNLLFDAHSVRLRELEQA